MLAQNARAAGRYQIHVVDDPIQASGLRLDWCYRWPMSRGVS